MVLHQPHVGAAGPQLTGSRPSGTAVTDPEVGRPVPTTAESLPGPLVVGLDLLTDRERHADDLALACAAALQAGGGRDLTVGTHWAARGEHRHVALVLQVHGLDAAHAAAALTAVTPGLSADATGLTSGGTGLLVGEQFRGAEDLQGVLEEAVRAQRTGTGGRAVVFPGSRDLVGTTTVADVLQCSAIDRVQVLGAAVAAPQTVLVTRDFVRPRWTGGELVLHAQPAAGGVLVPFESPDPTPCCAAHA